MTTPAPPYLRIVRGEPDAYDVAALVTALALRAAVDAGAARPGVRRPARRSAPGWADRSAGLRRPLSPGAGAWRASAWQ